MDILKDGSVLAQLKLAWITARLSGLEEGGFITKDASENLDIVRWPTGGQDSIRVPPHQNCKVVDRSIVATFHTHPNTGADYVQEPSETDKRAVRDDPDLKGADYVGEFVISYEMIFLITPGGRVREIAEPHELLGRT
jgi:hypothetical protein